MSKEGNDISNKVIFVLFVITLLVSATGTFLVLKKVNDVPETVSGPGYAAGSISLTVEKPVLTNGEIRMEVLPRGTDQNQ